MTAACEHDWRLFQSEERTHYDPGPDPWHTTVVIKPPATVTKHDTWYCTKCRLVEERERYVL